MSCQSLAARAFVEPDKDAMTHCSGLQRSVRFSSESHSRNSTRSNNDGDCKRETPGSISFSQPPSTPGSGSVMSQSAPTSHTFNLDMVAPPPAACRFPKLEECAHFHYERVSLGGLSIETVPCDDKCEGGDAGEGWVCLKVRSHINSMHEDVEIKTLCTSWTEASDVTEWTLARDADHFRQLDDLLHRCIYDRKVSNLPNLSEELTPSLVRDKTSYERLIGDYVHHLAIIADDSINCGPVLNWLQMDNKGHKLLVANEDSSSINTPAVAAAYSVRKYVSQARDEISFEVGDMISIIDMPGPQESLWWRGKRGFRVGFFPHNCVCVIGDKVPRHMTQPPPIVGSVAVLPIKPVLRKHGKLISLFRSFILSRPSRRSLKQQGILRERVFACDLGEHLLNAQRDVPLVLVECARALEARGAVDGVYRLSGASGLTQRLRSAFDQGAAPDLSDPPVQRDPHALASLLKMYFRELPNPLCTYQLYDSFVSAVQMNATDDVKLKRVREVVAKLPPPHYRTLAYLMRHLRRISLLARSTGMTSRNMAIVWAPNLLRSPAPHHALQGVAVQAVVTEFLICYAEELFSQEQGDIVDTHSAEVEAENQVELRGMEVGRRPKSLPLNPPTKLLSLEEARRRGCPAPPAPAPPPAPAHSTLADSLLRPSSHLRPKYIEVGSGPNNLPQYHTVLDLPIPGKRGIKRSPLGWRGLFSRSKQRARPAPPPPARPALRDELFPLRPVKSCESLGSDSDTLAPLADRVPAPLKQHTRSSSCDSYFEPWQAELADMRLRLSPQERDRHMFSEEDDTQLAAILGSSVSTPAATPAGSRADLRVDIHAANDAQRHGTAIEDQLSQISYIDLDSPRCKISAEKRHSARPVSPNQQHYHKRICKDRDSPVSSLGELQNSVTPVKMRERTSPRKSKNTSRYSGMHQPINFDDKLKQTLEDKHTRLSWPSKDGHSTLIKIDWPSDNSQTNLTTSTVNSPLTPVTPVYDPLDSDSEASEANKHTIKIESNCDNCDEEKCLKCELKATDYENIKKDIHDSLEPSPINSDISYQNLNRLSASSNETDKKHYESELKVMESSHESSSSYSNTSTKPDELYECYNFTRPNYINLQSSSSKSSPGSPLKSPLKSTISITFRSPTKSKNSDYEIVESTPTNERDSVYEDIDLAKNLSIVEDASVPEMDACLPTQQACQPKDGNQDLIILETPTENVDVYSQVKFFKKSIEEVNAMVLESPEKERHYENVDFGNDYENVDLKICDKIDVDNETAKERDNGNTIKTKVALNVRELANRFESPTEQKGPFTFEKFKADVKYPSLERKGDKEVVKKDVAVKLHAPVSPKTYKLSKNSTNARSLDENAFVKEFGNDKTYVDRRKSLEVKDSKRPTKFLPDLNLNMEESEGEKEIITPTSENKISLIQRFEKPLLISLDADKKLSRERIEKYKEERRNFLREKYSSQSFRSNPEQLTRLKLKKEDEVPQKEELPKFERRNTVDLGQRMRFSLVKSSNNLDTIQSPTSPKEICEAVGEISAGRSRDFERTEKVSPSYNIRDMAAMFEQKSLNNTNG